MKKKLIENTSPIETKKDGWWITVQKVEDILVLNVHISGRLQARHCINVENYEYATLQQGVWKGTGYAAAIGMSGDYWMRERWKEEQRFLMSKKDEETVQRELKAESRRGEMESALNTVRDRERERSMTTREKATMNHIRKINEKMGKVPERPAEIREWIDKIETGGEEYATKTGEKGVYACSKCGGKFEETKLKRADGGKARNNDKAICPICGKEIVCAKRKKKIEITSHFAVVQPIDDTMGVVRYFDTKIVCEGGKKRIGLRESARILLLKKDKKKTCELYYSQYERFYNWDKQEEERNKEIFDENNAHNRQMFAGRLYDGGIEEAFEGTVFDTWTRLFKEFSAAGRKLNYNRMMCAWDDGGYRNVIEMLYRGRFDKMLEQTSDDVELWDQRYHGTLNTSGKTIEGVFGIKDRQKINRIRETNGGRPTLEWMRWSEKSGEKISEKVLSWLIQNKIDSRKWTDEGMSLERYMNYIERQRRESYEGRSVANVIGQYTDYLSMCKKLKKDMQDEMVYRPRELKRRHDEAVIRIAERDTELQAEEYNERFKGVEDALEEIKDRYEYKNDKYRIIVPSGCLEIVVEGRALHHCVASSDRYFDRISQKETYIVFLRKNDAPNTPYYTVEVEPGGTIRQRRGDLDEEPDIEEIKPFLQEWQKMIRNRMTKEDHQRAAVSAEKRMENIKELEKKKNTRVLKGLREDFMEAM